MNNLPLQIRGNNNYEIQVLSSTQEINTVIPEWETFLANTANRHTIWQNPAVIQSQLKEADNEKPKIVFLRKKNQLECIAPCIIKKRQLKLKFSIFNFPGPHLRILKILDSDFIFSNTANAEACVIAIFRLLQTESYDFDLIQFENLAENSKIWSVLKTQKSAKDNKLKLVITSPKVEKNWELILADSFDAWLKSLRKKTRHEIKRREKKITEKFSEKVEFREVTDPEDIDNYFLDVNVIKPKTWQAKTFGDTEVSKKDIQFYQNIARNGWFRSYLMLINDQPIAYQTGLQYNNIFETSGRGYDPVFSKYGIGSILTALWIKDLHEKNKPSLINFGFGENEYKRMLCSNFTNANEAYIPILLRAKIVIYLQFVMSQLENIISRLIIKFKIDKSVRKLLKRK